VTTIISVYDFNVFYAEHKVYGFVTILCSCRKSFLHLLLRTSGVSDCQNSVTMKQSSGTMLRSVLQPRPFLRKVPIFFLLLYWKKFQGRVVYMLYRCRATT
jgi:hypothetical protein